MHPASTPRWINQQQSPTLLQHSTEPSWESSRAPATEDQGDGLPLQQPTDILATQKLPATLAYSCSCTNWQYSYGLQLVCHVSPYSRCHCNILELGRCPFYTKSVQASICMTGLWNSFQRTENIFFCLTAPQNLVNCYKIKLKWSTEHRSGIRFSRIYAPPVIHFQEFKHRNEGVNFLHTEKSEEDKKQVYKHLCKRETFWI